MTTKFRLEYEGIVALNTFRMLYRFDVEHGVYGDSPNGADFDGSATGYWSRRAIHFGVSQEEIEQIKRDVDDQVSNSQRA